MATFRQTLVLLAIAALAISGLQHADATRGPEKSKPGKGRGPPAKHDKDKDCERSPTCEQLQATTNSALNKVIWPTSANIALSGTPLPEFSVDVRGRIVPVGNFEVSRVMQRHCKTRHLTIRLKATCTGT